MFVSTKQLVTNYGIDTTTARFFVDREPPADNLYWHEKLLYLRPSPGYLFIPLIVDLLAKAGIKQEQLLSEAFVGTMEEIGHISALEEAQKITGEEALKHAVEMVNSRSKNSVWLENVTNYLFQKQPNFLLHLTTPFKALHRGDIFLLSLSVISFPADLFEKVAKHWFALITTLLLLDDAEDIQTDKQTNDENAFLESGLTVEGLERINTLVAENIRELGAVNPQMAKELERQFKERMQMPDIVKLINC